MRKLLLLNCVGILLANSAYGLFDYSYSDGSSSAGADRIQDTVEVDEGVVSTAAALKCERGDAVTFDFIKKISISGPPEITVSGNKLNVSIGEYVSACIDGISASRVSVGSTNDVLLKFDIEPGEELNIKPEDMTQEDFDRLSLDEKYMKCVNRVMADKGIKGNKKLKFKLKQAGLSNKTGYTASFSLDSVNQKELSEVVVMSPYEDRNFSNVSHGLGKNLYRFPEDKKELNCMNYEQPYKQKLMANTTRHWDLNMEAQRVCRNPSLADIKALREKMSKEDIGNLQGIMSVVDEIEKELLEKRTKEMLKEMSAIEKELVEYYVRDKKDGDVDGDEEANEIMEKYSSLVKEFTDEVLPSIHNRLKYLLEKRDKASKDEQKSIDKQVAALNKLAKKFDREQIRKKEFKAFAAAMQAYDMYDAAEEIIIANYKARLAGKVSSIDGKQSKGKGRNKESSLSLVNAIEKGEEDATFYAEEIIEDWSRQRASLDGDASPYRLQASTYQKLAKTYSYKKEEQMNTYRDDLEEAKYQFQYRQQYLSEAQSKYCSGFVQSEQCTYFQQYIAPSYYQNFSNAYSKSVQEAQVGYQRNLSLLNSTYTPVLSQEKSLLEKYGNLYKLGVNNRKQESVSNSRRNQGGISGLGSSTVDYDSYSFWSDTGLYSDFGLESDVLLNQINIDNSGLGNSRSPAVFGNPLQNNSTFNIYP